MKLFKKKTFDYKVVVYVPSVDSMQQQMELSCSLERDKEDRLLYLVDNATGGENFKELFPGDNKKIFEKEEIDKYKETLDELKRQKKNIDKTSTDNYLNIDKKIYEIEHILNKYKEEKGSFVYMDNKGQKYISYLRKSTGLHPLHYNIYTNNVFLPVESESRDAFLSWKSKYEALQNKKDDMLKTFVTVFGILVGGLILLSLGYGGYKLNTYNAEMDKAMIDQKYICQEIYEKGVAKIIATNQNTADELNQKAKQIQVINNSDLDPISSGIKVTADILS